MGKKKSKKWVEGLSWSNTELEAISRGMGSEAFDYTYQREYPTTLQMRGAKKQLRKRYRNRDADEW